MSAFAVSQQRHTIRLRAACVLLPLTLAKYRLQTTVNKQSLCTSSGHYTSLRIVLTSLDSAQYLSLNVLIMGQAMVLPSASNSL